TTFDCYTKEPIQATSLLQTYTDNSFENLTLSPVLQENNENLEFSILSCSQSIFILEPKELDDSNNFARFSQSLSLLPHDKDTTQ
ncbi:15847_t:CDS:1, partial [Gigaspora margarita]